MSRPKNPNNNYFTDETEAAIIAFNNTEDMDEKNRIYETSIKEPIEKLAQNHLHTFKISYVEDWGNIEAETVNHLVMNLHYFMADKGKAFSFFTVCARNYLFQLNNANYKRFCKLVPIDFQSEYSEGNFLGDAGFTKPVDYNPDSGSFNQFDYTEYCNAIVEYWSPDRINSEFKAKQKVLAHCIIKQLASGDSFKHKKDFRRAVVEDAKQPYKFTSSHWCRVLEKMTYHNGLLKKKLLSQ